MHVVRLPNSSSLTGLSQSLWWVSLWTVHSAKETPGAFIGVHELPGDGGQIQSIRQVLVDIEEHSIVEVLLGHGRSSEVDFDASDGRKGPFPSCSDNRACEIEPHPAACLPQSLNMLEASGAAASMFAGVQTLVTLEAMSANIVVHNQKIWQQTELSFKLPHVNVLVIQVVNLRRDQWSIICSGISQSDRESRAKAW